MREKFDETTSEVLSHDAQIVRITETWFSTDVVIGVYQMVGCSVFSNYRPTKAGGSVAINESADLTTYSCTPEVSLSDSYNVCAVFIGESTKQLLG